MTKPPAPPPESLVSTATVVAALEKAFRALAPGRRVAEVRRAPALYHSSHRLEDVTVRLDDGTSLQLVLKPLGPGALLDDADVVKPKFLYDPMREPAAYDLLAASGISVPRYVGFGREGAGGHFFLLLEKAPGVPLWQVGEPEAWREAARWLGTMHSRLMHAPGLRKVGPLLCYDRTFFDVWPRRVMELTAGDSACDDRFRTLGRIVDHYSRVVERLVRIPTTMVHGEYYPSNILIDSAGTAPRVLPVDWEMAGVGPGLLDLADLAAGTWTDAERESMVRSYTAVLDSGLAPPPEEFDTALDACRLHKAIQWLGWSRSWVPPAEHRHDWLGEALRLGEKLKLI